MSLNAAAGSLTSDKGPEEEAPEVPLCPPPDDTAEGADALSEARPEPRERILFHNVLKTFVRRVLLSFSETYRT